MNPRAHHPGGFTLLELLISLTLLGMLGLTMFSGLWFGMQTWHRAAVFDRRADDGSAVRRAVEGLLEHTYPLYMPATKAGPAGSAPAMPAGIDFTGTDDKINFLAPTPQALGGGGLSRFILKVEKSDQGEALKLLAQPELTNSPDDWIESTILDHVKTVEFEYYPSGGQQAEVPNWLHRWGRQSALPRLIRIKVIYPEESGINWAPLIIAPRIAVDATCQLDMTSLGCQGR